jgi:hypothetical protein
MSLSDVLLLVGPGLMFVWGLFMFFVPRRFQRDHSAYYDRRLAERLERGEDAYFEELRTIQAYRKPYHDSSIRFFGALLACLSASTLVLRLLER